MATNETMELLDQVAARSATTPTSAAAEIRTLFALLDDAAAEAKRLRRLTESAIVTETAELIAGNFGELVNTLQAIERLVGEVEKPLGQLQTAFRQIPSVEKRLRDVISEAAATESADAT